MSFTEQLAQTSWRGTGTVTNFSVVLQCSCLAKLSRNRLYPCDESARAVEKDTKHDLNLRDVNQMSTKIRIAIVECLNSEMYIKPVFTGLPGHLYGPK
jgi:hypothetical protein